MGIGVIFLIIGIAFFMLISRSFIVINQYEEGVKFRYGRYVGKLNPGINFLIPLIDTIKIIDMRIHSIDVPHQNVITKDNATVKIEAIIYYRIVDAEKVVLNIAQYESASIWRAQTSLRAIIGDMVFDSLNSEREYINQRLTNAIKGIGLAWGIEIISAEIGEVKVDSSSLFDALVKQVRAERLKRACILTSEGMRESAILNAQGIKQATETTAFGLSQAKINVAQGEAESIKLVSDSARSNLIGPALTLWELNMWKTISSNSNTTAVLPYDVTNWMNCMKGVEGIIDKT
ncbi:MAG: SPFH domain-containing protein [Candidatus Micrarchaeota archaeon]